MIFKVVAPIDALYIDAHSLDVEIEPNVLKWFDDNNIRPYLTMYKQDFTAEPRSRYYTYTGYDDSILSYFFVFNEEKDAMLFTLRWA